MRMGTLEYEAIQRESMKKYDRLVKKYNAILCDGGEDLKLKAKIDAINAEMNGLYAKYRAGTLESRQQPQQPAQVRFVNVIPQWN